MDDPKNAGGGGVEINLYIWVKFLNPCNFGDYMYDFGGRKTSIARPFIKKELCNQRPF